MQSKSDSSHSQMLLNYFSGLPDTQKSINLLQYSTLMDFKLTSNDVTFSEVLNFYEYDENKNFLQMHSQISWTDQEWKILIWIVISYCTLKNIQNIDMVQNDWNIVGTLVKFKNALNCQYKWLCHSILKEDRYQWKEEEEQLLIELLTNCKNLKWHEIQYQIFMKSNGKFFRKAKQCRERWNNYLDPTIDRGIWKPEEDLLLMRLSQSEGLKWSKISQKMKNRTENQVKNRFKSLVNRESKIQQQNLQLETIISNIIIKLQNTQILEEKPQKVICIENSQQQPIQPLHYQNLWYYQYYQQQWYYNYVIEQQQQLLQSQQQQLQQQLIKTEEVAESSSHSRSNSFCQLLDKLSLDSKSLTQDNGKPKQLEVELKYNNQTKSQSNISFQSENQGKTKSNKQRFKHTSIDQ